MELLITQLCTDRECSGTIQGDGQRPWGWEGAGTAYWDYEHGSPRMSLLQLSLPRRTGGRLKEAKVRRPEDHSSTDWICPWPSLDLSFLNRKIKKQPPARIPPSPYRENNLCQLPLTLHTFHTFILLDMMRGWGGEWEGEKQGTQHEQAFPG